MDQEDQEAQVDQEDQVVQVQVDAKTIFKSSINTVQVDQVVQEAQVDQEEVVDANQEEVDHPHPQHHQQLQQNAVQVMPKPLTPKSAKDQLRTIS
jgi:hypothetical protein